MSVLSACMSVNQVRAWCPESSEEGIRSPAPGATDGSELYVGAEKITQVHSRSSKYLNRCAISLVLHCFQRIPNKNNRKKYK